MKRQDNQVRSPERNPGAAGSRKRRVGLVLLGILIGQLILYGPSFAGTKILLPLEALSLPKTYIPMKPGQLAQTATAHLTVASDPVLEDEPARIFRHAELRAGRLPLWNPSQYAGVPNLSFLSPFAIFAALLRSPRILPWLSFLLASVSGLGMYVFARRVLAVSVWPATIAAWCYPLTGFFLFWQSTSLAHPVVWLPWFLYAIHSVVAKTGPWSAAGLAVATALTIISGHLDMAGLILIAGGLFATWDVWFTWRKRGQVRQAMRASATLLAGWLIGFMLASPELLPALEYAKTGSRLSKRGAGSEERPPLGLVSLPQLILPDVYGKTGNDTLAILPEKEAGLMESPSAGFAGLIVTLVAAPLAWGSRRHRSIAIFLTALGLLGMAWCLDLPGFVQVMRIPPFNLLSYNRFVFASSFAILGLATIGLQEVSTPGWRWHTGYYLPIVILGGTALWCLFRTFVPPEMIGVTLPRAIRDGYATQWIHDAEGVRQVQTWFVRMYVTGAILSLIGLSVWLFLRMKKTLPSNAPLLLGALAIAELLFLGFGRAAQSDPLLYYPPIPPVDRIARAAPGRTVAYKCLPANLLQTQGLFDIRGYDGVDPARMIDLLDLAAAPDSGKFDYAAAQFFVPRIAPGRSPALVKVSPVLDLLNVRYVIAPSEDYTGYFVLVNESALPRAFLPRTIEIEPDRARRLAALGNPSFNPLQVAYLEDPGVSIPAAEGDAAIIEDTPQHITIRTNLTRSGLVILADQWNSGWQATIEGKPAPIVRVDHALRGIAVPKGENIIVFRYRPFSVRLGVGTAVVGVFLLIGCILINRRAQQKMNSASPTT
jgi:hypothetical protein